MIEKNDIPQEVIDEVASQYAADWSDYGLTDPAPDWTTRRLSFRRYGEFQMVKTIDLETFESVQTMGTPYEMFIVRGSFNDDDNTAKIHQVISTGMVLAK